MLTATRLAVWGDPIEHSISPRLHAAAYAVLDLPWEYERRRVGEAEFAGALAGLGSSWRGLSLTMPLKRVAAASASTIDDSARRTGAVNTLLLAADGPRGFNTDVDGLVAALHDDGVDEVARGRIVGAGATAASALVAFTRLGARHVEIVARRPEALPPLIRLGDELGVAVSGAPSEGAGRATVTISTLPGGADLGERATSLAADGGLLVDVVYGSWPTPLAETWQLAGGRARSGLGMLAHQALRQVRIFVNGSPDEPVEREADVLAAMRQAAMGD
ncbi:shikimate dehydrogenase family protein [Microbacterium sp. P05]|uniref:shikimate dehydrogenase family protein n=1 Tax=Microbacterium sp. P05 TaxID=3366948 RepID=UPI003744FC8D